MSLMCCLGWHEDAIRDQAADGVQVLRCPRCMYICHYPETEVSALRAEQKRQAGEIASRHAQSLAVKRAWRSDVETVR